MHEQTILLAYVSAANYTSGDRGNDGVSAVISLQTGS